MEWLILGIIILLTLINVPIGFALSLSAIVLLLWKGSASLSVVPLNLFSGASSFPLLAIPLFILAGGLMETSGISLRLVNMANSLVGFIRGGLAMVTVVATMIQSEISGSSVADAAAIGNVVIPAMEKRGYPRALSAAIVSNAASAAILIPPSIPMIIYAWMAETSVAKLFFAGFLPGAIACAAMMALSYYYARKYNLPVEQSFSIVRVAKSTAHAFWALFIPIVIWGGIFLGIATATEVAALAVLAAFIIGVLIYRELPVKELVRVLKDSAGQTAVVMLIVASSAVLGWYLTSEQIPQKFARLILETTSNKYLILLFLNIFFLVAGMFLHSAAAIILIVPIVMPLIRQIGVDPIHFGIIVTINLGVGQQTPPVATVLFTTAAIARIPFWDVFKAGWPFTVVLALVTLLVTYVPWISLGLVNMIKW
ncbi:MAG: TRAP transporter large permease [Deltaproteobacteria bacterium]|nr:TRAP transporter large permease [Deltaproteobacteria bacterium]MBI2347358.1 TRAP transporter large permease [Deltaproteobacteria bacterium]